MERVINKDTVDTFCTILTPLYNGVEFIDDYLESLQTQTYKQFEAIIGINGYDWGSEVYNTVKNTISHNKYKNIDIKVFEYDTKGKVATLNRMMLDASYDIICLLDIDDIWLPHKLERQMDIWCLYNYDVVGTNCYYFRDRNKYNCKQSPNIPFGPLSGNFFSGNPVINSSVMITRRDAWWNEDSYNLEDYDIWLRLRYENKTFFNIAEPLVKHRLHKNSYFNNTNNKYRKNLLNVWKIKYGDKSREIML